ncbi:carbohydrate ABC transporter permease [Paenibacillus protaetiae]|uniref:Carbohydrate ABC transporter permease n=1 Tax=Paenibacillus protaetiae TaxID=2509456 RepID=A0A4P6EYP4_9BACL|nr:carbohydrate ABC transporter permease [Paenibacillus protaetiae]QAY67976.1 carbohydrate ABC transporter permease [Paenibacillus protaetiae]
MSSQDRNLLSRYDFNKTSVKVSYGLIMLLVVVMVVTMLYPIFSTLFNALKSNEEVNSFPPHFLPEGSWHFSNFKEGWNFIDLPLFLRNTLLIFAGNLVVTILVLGFAAYSLSKLTLPKKKLVNAFFMTTLFIPPTTYLIPNFLNLQDFGLLNSFFAFWLPAGANAYYLLLLKSFFDGLSGELFEAARVDGASELRCFLQIAVPLSIPIISTLAIFIFNTSWNDWFWPSMVMHSDHRYPLATAIYKYIVNARMLDLNIKFAILTITTIPPIVVFLVFQRYIIGGLQLGGVKG